MKNKLERRHSRWYEVVLLSPVLLFLIGAFVVVFMPAWLRWGEFLIRWPLTGFQLNTLIANGIAFTITFLLLNQVRRYPGTSPLAYIIPTTLLSWFVVFTALLFMREGAYSRQLLLSSFFLANLWAFMGFFIASKYSKRKFAIVPYGDALNMPNNEEWRFDVLTSPDLKSIRYDGIVVDLRSADLTESWLRFLAKCTLWRIPVYHTVQVTEALTGRVKIERLSENQFGSLMPSSIYGAFKRFLDVVFALVLIPFITPLMVATAVAIKLDSPGPVFFNQKRMGYRGRVFTMYKFRSMRANASGKEFTDGKSDPRITKVGRFIRKFRIDEIPQVFNVLKGDMSFIGPRPESLSLSKWYEQEIPFFNYRHVVRPGISGWAQVNQGYASEVDGVTVKLQYDFYYIKHFSLWLDVLITFKTIKTVLTGYGAR